MHCLDNDIELREFLRAITHLKDNKAPELNAVPPNAFKRMDERIFRKLCIDSFANSEEEIKPIKIAQCQVVLCSTKNGDTSSTNK